MYLSDIIFNSYIYNDLIFRPVSLDIAHIHFAYISKYSELICQILFFDVFGRFFKIHALDQNLAKKWLNHQNSKHTASVTHKEKSYIKTKLRGLLGQVCLNFS